MHRYHTETAQQSLFGEIPIHNILYTTTVFAGIALASAAESKAQLNAHEAFDAGSLARVDSETAHAMSTRGREVDMRSALVLNRTILPVSFDPDATVSPPSQQQSTLPTAPAGADSAELAKKLSNPVASLISVPVQFNIDTGLGQKNADRMTVNIQPVIPVSIGEEWNLIIRTIVPVVYQESLFDGDDSDFGIGDTTQSFFFSPKDPVGGWILAAGPVALWPTGTDPQLRSEQLGFGPTVLALRQEHGWTCGALANHIWGVSDSDTQDEISTTFLQPFLAYAWPSATTITVNTESTYDWNDEQWTVPLNIILSQIIKFGEQPVQLFVGYRQYVEAPTDGPEWGVRFGITFLFPR